MNTKLFSEAISEVGDKYYEEAANYHCKKHRWIKWSAMAACLCLIISGMYLLRPNDYNEAGNNGGIVMLFTEAKVVEVFSPRSVLVEITKENIYNANTDENLFNVGDMVQAEFNEDIVLHFVSGDVVIIGRGNTAKTLKSKRKKITEIFGLVQKLTREQKTLGLLS